MAKLDQLNIKLIGESELRNIIGSTINPGNAVIIAMDINARRPHSFIAKEDSGRPSSRSSVVIEYIHSIFGKYPNPEPAAIPQSRYFIFQGDDNPVNEESASWQSRKTYDRICLVPDFYYTMSQGYTRFFVENVPAWSDKSAAVFWRGSTTGGWGITIDSLQQLPRYRLCRLGLPLGAKVNFGICNVVQTKSPEAKESIERTLIAEKIFKEPVPLETYANFKFFVQIDGNGNSWELVKKLRLGSCMLLVESDWVLYHYKIILPWKHYVPVKSDLSNIQDIVEWCLTHDAETEQIARNARQLAMSIDFNAEIRDTADSLLDLARVSSLNPSRI